MTASRVSIHEATHAVCAAALGWTVLEVSRLPTEDGLDGFCRALEPVGWPIVDGHARPNLDDPLVHDRVARWLAWLMAPIAGQLVFGADPGCWLDRELAWSILEEVEPDPAARQRVVTTILEQSRAFIGRHEHLIVLLAQVLDRCGCLGRVELLQTIRMIQGVGRG